MPSSQRSDYLIWSASGSQLADRSEPRDPSPPEGVKIEAVCGQSSWVQTPGSPWPGRSARRRAISQQRPFGSPVAIIEPFGAMPVKM